MKEVNSVLIIRESEEQITGSDCCGVLIGEFCTENDSPVFQAVRDSNQQVLKLGKYLKDEYGNRVDIKYIDPRNQVYLLPKLFKDVWKYKPGFTHALKVIFQFFRCPAVIINGMIMHNAFITSPNEIEKFLKD